MAVKITRPGCRSSQPYCQRHHLGGIWSGTYKSENDFSVKLSSLGEHNNYVFSLLIVQLSRQCLVKSSARATPVFKAFFSITRRRSPVLSPTTVVGVRSKLYIYIFKFRILFGRSHLRHKSLSVQECIKGLYEQTKA